MEMYCVTVRRPRGCSPLSGKQHRRVPIRPPRHPSMCIALRLAAASVVTLVPAEQRPQSMARGSFVQAPCPPRGRAPPPSRRCGHASSERPVGVGDAGRDERRKHADPGRGFALQPSADPRRLAKPLRACGLPASRADATALRARAKRGDRADVLGNAQQAAPVARARCARDARRRARLSPRRGRCRPPRPSPASAG